MSDKMIPITFVFVLLVLPVVAVTCLLPLTIHNASAFRSNTLNFTITPEQSGQQNTADLTYCYEQNNKEMTFTIIDPNDPGSVQEGQRKAAEEQEMLQECRQTWQNDGTPTDITIHTTKPEYAISPDNAAWVRVWGKIGEEVYSPGQELQINLYNPEGDLYFTPQKVSEASSDPFRQIDNQTGMYRYDLVIVHGGSSKAAAPPGNWSIVATYGDNITAKTQFELVETTLDSTGGKGLRSNSINITISEEPSRELTIDTDKESYSAGETVIVTGNIIEHGTWTTELRYYDIALQIFDQDGVLYLGDQVSVDNEASMQYEWEFTLGNEGPVFPGLYLVMAASNEMVAETTFTVTEASDDPSGDGTITVMEANGTDSGQSIVVQIDNTEISEEQGQHVQVVEIRSSDGVTEFLQLQPPTGDNMEISWTPKSAGNYQVRTFMIDDIEMPQKITPIQTKEFSFS
jgi:hypothetical protein